MLISVVLPAPFGPRNANMSPFRIARSTCFSAWNPVAERLGRVETEMIAVMAATIAKVADGGCRSCGRARPNGAAAAALPSVGAGRSIDSQQSIEGDRHFRCGKEFAMCYEFSNWFERARAKELQRAREKLDAAKRAAADTPAPQPERKHEDVKEPEKMPA